VTFKTPELLAPAGNFEKLKFAIYYGADAVYIGGSQFSLRANAGNFTPDEVREGVGFAHQRGKRVYLAVNIFARNDDLPALEEYLPIAARIGVDAFLISDPGVFSLAKKIAPQVPIHISTQANNVNWQTASFWKQAGAKRIVLGRELSLLEAAEIGQKSGVETELFVHGAICISYSGRCLLSNFLTVRDANQGDCSHPCRWKYRLQEEKRPGESFDVEEDNKGSYIMNSRDLSLMPLLPQLLAANLDAWKIEGRNKSAYYVANITRIYRRALDEWRELGPDFQVKAEWLKELETVSHRDYTTGFAASHPDSDSYRYDDGGYIRNYDFAAIIEGFKDGLLHAQQRNNFGVGDEIDLLIQNGENLTFQIESLYDEQGVAISVAPHAKQRVLIKAPQQINNQLAKLSYPLIVRRKVRV